MQLDQYKNIMVFIEQREGEIQKVSFELLGKGRELADKLGVELKGVLLGSKMEKLAKEVTAHGADEAIVVDDEMLEVYTTNPYTKALADVINKEKPEIFLIGATTIGRDLAPRVAARVKTGLTADCTSLEIDEETNNLLMTRPAFGGNLMATIICPEHRPQMSSVRPGVMPMPSKNVDSEGVITSWDAKLSKEDIDIEVLEVVKEEKEKVNIEDANVLVSGGRGLGSEENFGRLRELAKVLDGEVSASRAVVDAGWTDGARQVGQTGKTVRPNLYIACGISGAIQHVAGMEESDFIIAINKNSNAAIFERADIGIVGDVNKVLPALINELNK
ncbi:electron transfer flavoprotein subunit alpha/FixB family protein [Proteinivorax hydrogeniformans]|uniref:Electron transfer flavoprotein subunit alpha/FixB family protein n=1 Tax=Proteinivorax hydrogeniformans TaxID=1826727 RepID=A0AAU8HS67_9FIRM